MFWVGEFCEPSFCMGEMHLISEISLNKKRIVNALLKIIEHTKMFSYITFIFYCSINLMPKTTKIMNIR